MKNSKLAIYLLIFTIALVSCMPKTKVNNSDIPIISKESIKDTVYLNSLIKSIKYVKLETKMESIIASIRSINMDDSLLFIRASNGHHDEVFVFNLDGKFMNKIGEAGRAKNEYIRMQYWAIDRWNKEVLIGDPFSSRILRYSYDGAFVDAIEMSENFRGYNEMYVISKEYLAFKNSVPTKKERDLINSIPTKEERQYRESRYVIADRSLNIISTISDRGISIHKKYGRTIGCNIAYNNSNGIVYARDIVNDTLYKWKDNKFVPELLIYLDDCKASDIDASEDFDIISDNEKYDVYKYELIVNDYMFVSGKYFIDLKNKTAHHFKLDKSNTTVNNTYPMYHGLQRMMPFRYMYSSGNYLFGYIDTSTLLNLQENEAESKVKQPANIKELCKMTTREDNPTIFIYELK